METLAIRNLSFSYPGERQNAVDHVDLTLKSGEFLVLCGPSGCGKSTLLRQLKTALAPKGRREGELLLDGVPLERLDQRTQSREIGFVQQSPENQLVTDKVWHELAFGLESLGLDSPAIRRRVAEMASFFGMESWFHRPVSALSGGQKQLLNLAAAMVTQPDLLILDEPTSQLDPIAASEFLSMLARINREMGTTILLTEHRLEEALPLSDRAAVMDEGRLLCMGTPREVGETLRRRNHGMFLAMPAAMRIWAAVETERTCPVTVREGRAWLREFSAAHPPAPLPEPRKRPCPQETVLEARELWFRYGREQGDVLRGLNLQAEKGELLALLGGNGAGKTTALQLLAGLEQPQRGTVTCRGRAVLLPQDPGTLFVKKTLREDLLEVWEGRTDGTRRAQLEQTAALCRLDDLLERHPYDLSGGERQRAALAKVLLLRPDILLLDEPTKGLDAGFKQTLGEIFQTLLRRGVTLVMVSHDLDFCARYAHRCVLLFDGAAAAEGPPRSFFSGNSFYTTASNRMARELAAQAVTPEEVIAVCGGRAPQAPAEKRPGPPVPPAKTPPQKEQPLPLARKLLAWGSGAVILLGLLGALGTGDLSALTAPAGVTALGRGRLCRWGAAAAAMLVFGLSITRRPLPTECPPAARRKPARRTVIAAGLMFLAIPLTLLAGVRLLDSSRYGLVSMLVLAETMTPFFLLFEGRAPRARELAVVAALCAISVAGRAALFMLPEFKPVWAVTIVAGVSLGGETGFLVGAMTMLVSNLLFSQGPWTPWQMFAMGLVGFLAGVLFSGGRIRKSRLTLCVFGALAALVVYGGIMNLASALLWGGGLTWGTVLAYVLSGFPVDCVHAAATWMFLWFGAEPMLDKLDRVGQKYGLLE
ncbi:ATP-binding cassette domain-containing protein [Dysosmobacter sp.]